ncbi:hypothetical protein PCANC_04660, partial [Puccinia coronata f. sp. avenae]
YCMPETRCSTSENSAFHHLSTDVPLEKMRDREREDFGVSKEEDIAYSYPEFSLRPGMINFDESHEKPWILPPLTDLTNLSTQTKVETPSLGSYQVAWIPGDPENPQDRTLASKHLITIGCCIMAFNVALASSAPSSAFAAITHEFDVSDEMATCVTSIFLCGYIAGPLLWGPLSELIGRQPVVLGTFAAFILFQLGAALRISFPALLASRALTGFFGSGSLCNSGAVIADVWDSVHRAHALSWQVTMPFLGTALGPVLGSAINKSGLGYPWIFWSIMILSVATWFLIFFTVPETYSPILLVKKAKKLRETTGDVRFYAEHEKANCSFIGILRRTLLRPVEMMMTEPILLLILVYFSTIFGILFSLFETFPIIWQEKRGFNSYQTSMIFIGIAFGSVLGRFVHLFLAIPMKRMVNKWYGHPPCEMNLHGAMGAGPMLVGGIFWLGWTGTNAHITWFNMVFISLQCYMIDVYLTYAASALAASTICRAIVGAVVPLFTRQMYIGLGTQWACTLIGSFSLIISLSPFIFYKYGSKIRAKSKFSSALDLQMKERIDAENKKRILDLLASKSNFQV